MGLWVELEGTIKANNFSVKKSLTNILDSEGLDSGELTVNIDGDKFTAAFDGDGMQGAYVVDCFCKDIKYYDKNAWYDIITNLRFKS